MMSWLEWFLGLQDDAGLDVLFLGFLCQWMVAAVITAGCAPLHWSRTRFFLTTLFWPVVLVLMMVSVIPVKTQHVLDQRADRKKIKQDRRREHAIAVVWRYIDQYGDPRSETRRVDHFLAQSAPGRVRGRA